jgi:hypothetical protein
VSRHPASCQRCTTWALGRAEPPGCARSTA